jgi:photosystem II stability/assembly factor-like uncharacterized protein
MFYRLAKCSTKVQFGLLISLAIGFLSCIGLTNSHAQLAGDHFEHIWPKTAIGQFREFQYVTDSVWIAYGDFPGIFRSDDKGITWRKLPIYTTSLPSCVHFINPDIGFAGNGRGTIFQTNDGGNEWQIVYQDTSTYPMRLHESNQNVRLSITKIVSTDSQHIYALAECRYVLQSADQGKSWTRYDTELLTRRMDDIQFASPEVGYIFAGGLILKTENGGDSWPILADQTGFRGDIKRFFCLDKQRMYIVGNYARLRYSDDGGFSWFDRDYTFYDSTGKQIVPIDRAYWPELWRFEFADSLNGLAYIIHKDGYREHFYLAYTKDGGRSFHQIPGTYGYHRWDVISYNPKGDFYLLHKENREMLTMGRDFRLKLMGEKNPDLLQYVTAIDSNHAIVYQRTSHQFPNSQFIRHIIDGKSVIDTIPYTVGQQFTAKPPLKVINSKVLYGIGSFVSQNSYSYDRLIRSLDKGSNWEIPLHLDQYPEMGTWICSFKAFSVDSLCLLTLDSATNQLRFWNTQDGGKNWALVFQDFEDFPAIRTFTGIRPHMRNLYYDMDFWDKQNGVIYIGGEHILRTYDAGASWQHQLLGQQDLVGNKIIYPKDLSVQLLPNGQGMIYFTAEARKYWSLVFITRDFGATWTSVNFPEPYPRSIRLAPNNFAYQIPDEWSHPIYQTADGGKIWDPYFAIQTYAALTDLSFYSATGGFALDFNGNVYRFTYPFTYRTPLVSNVETIPNVGESVIYPNPTDGLLYYHITNLEPSHVRLYDLTGKKLIDSTLQTMSRSSIDLAPFQSGIYLLEVENQGKKTVHKVVRY